MLNKETISSWFKELQDAICQSVEQADGKGKFEEELWSRPGGGGGRTRIIQSGNILEKGGVNFSAVDGKLSPLISEALQISDPDFFATGVSIVMHPHSPMVPIIHMNVRYFEAGNEKWFGGGIDLTPHYVNEEDAAYFHSRLKLICDQAKPGYYDRFKQWADDYFFIRHRNETRGIGGIFFDRLKAEEGQSLEDIFTFVQSVGLAFAPIYTHFMTKNAVLPFGEHEKKWQYLRRGRYVEFNLVYDKGTKFGFETDGRTESILMSLPPQAQWEYNFQPEKGSKEENTISMLKKGINWV